MRIKKTDNGNEYRLTKDGIWVRDFTKNITPIDINALTSKKDYASMVENEVSNDLVGMIELNASLMEYPKCLIISDGYQFDKKQQLLVDLPKDVMVFAVNRALAKWKINRKIDYYVVNNPYHECMTNLPKHRYYPKCIASSKTYHGFLTEYNKRGHGVRVYRYCPVAEKSFAPSQSGAICMVDDYRNPICAAIGLAYKFKVKKLMLMCCDDSFEGERPAAEQLQNGLWTYPQHQIVHGIVEANLSWLRGVNVVSHSSGPEYAQAPYIPEDEVLAFFEDKWGSKSGSQMKSGLQEEAA